MLGVNVLAMIPSDVLSSCSILGGRQQGDEVVVVADRAFERSPGEDEQIVALLLPHGSRRPPEHVLRPCDQTSLCVRSRLARQG
jgi:hypothetical protein